VESLSQPASHSAKRIRNSNPLDALPILQVLGEKHLAASLVSRPQNLRVPERESVKAVEVDGGQDVTKLGDRNVELGKQFNLAASH